MVLARAGGGEGVNSGIPVASEQILVHELPFAPGPTCPGSTPRGRDSLTRPLAGPGSARGRDSFGWAPRDPGTTFTMSQQGFPTLPHQGFP